MLNKKEDKPKHLYLTNRPRWMSLVIDLIGPVTLLAAMVQSLLYPTGWQLTFVMGVVAFGIINHGRYDTKKIEDNSDLFATIMTAIPNHKYMDVAGVCATMALKYAKENLPSLEDGQTPQGLGVDMDVDGDKYVLLFTRREHFDKMTAGNIKRGAPDLRVIH